MPSFDRRFKGLKPIKFYNEHFDAYNVLEFSVPNPVTESLFEEFHVHVSPLLRMQEKKNKKFHSNFMGNPQSDQYFFQVTPNRDVNGDHSGEWHSVYTNYVLLIVLDLSAQSFFVFVLNFTTLLDYVQITSPIH